MKQTKASVERAAVCAALVSYEKNGSSANTTALQKKMLDEHPEMDERQRAFAVRLFRGCVERRSQLDAVAAPYIQRKPAKHRILIGCILRMGIYQICFMDSVPDSAACNECVELARESGAPESTGFINAVLRNIIRNRPEVLPDELETMPEWIRKMWEAEYGKERTEAIIRALLAPRPLTVRISPLLSDTEQEQLIRTFGGRGITVRKAAWLDGVYYLEHTGDIRRLPGFREGSFTVQDEASMMPVIAAAPGPSDTVMDICAAPGGKTIQAAQLLLKMNRDDPARCAEHVRAFDISPKKTALIRENAVRNKVADVIRIGIRDALKDDFEQNEDPEVKMCDVLICDLPCSGLGVAGRKPDIKYRVTMEDIRQLAGMQRKMLAAGIPYLKKGGTLIYSTCTISRQENEENARYISEELGLVPDPLTPYLPGGLFTEEELEAGTNSIQLMPDTHHTDGFFIARFRKP